MGEYMDFMLNGELQFLKRTSSEDKKDLVNKEKMKDMEQSKSEYLSQNTEMLTPERAVSPDLAAAIAEAMGTSEVPFAEEPVMDQAAIVAAAFRMSDDAEAAASDQAIEFSVSQYDNELQEMKAKAMREQEATRLDQEESEVATDTNKETDDDDGKQETETEESADAEPKEDALEEAAGTTKPTIDEAAIDTAISAASSEDSTSENEEEDTEFADAASA